VEEKCSDNGSRSDESRVTRGRGNNKSSGCRRAGRAIRAVRAMQAVSAVRTVRAVGVAGEV
jgi:hypothetical protein